MSEIKRTFEAYIDAYNLITVIVPKSYCQEPMSTFTLERQNETFKLSVSNVTDIIYAMKYECTHSHHIEIGQRYDVVDSNGKKTDLQIGAVIRTKEFDETFRYDGNDLGITYAKENTTWKVWAPTATAVRLRIYKEYIEEHDMERQGSGIWSYKIAEDCDKYEYTYLLCINMKWRESSDSYSLAVTPDSKKSIVVDMKKTKQVPPPTSVFKQKTDAIIYEAHIRDLTIQDETLKYRGKFKGLTETAKSDTTVGIPYIKDLGITHLELLPFNDFAGTNFDKENKYNWGYNPVHFNTPEGWYATDPSNPYKRIEELKELITTLHENGIRVIMDVVYNHIYIYEDCSFGKTVPGYFFRYDQNGMPSNGTGVGNDIASERYMARKFIVDSVTFWAKEYGIDGFRFDLMGILDVETLNSIRKAVNKINPEILLLGEGWNLNTPLPHEERASIHNAKKMPGIAFFNDHFRDTIKGSTFRVMEKGYVFGNSNSKEETKYLLAGSAVKNTQGEALFTQPSQTVNYVECHDNYTMWDKLEKSNLEESEATKRKRHTLATTFVFLSQGISFLHAGQEFYRTKQGVENSYASGDKVNQIDWQRRDTHQEIVDYIKGIIHLRKSHGAFRLATTAEVEKHMQLLEVNEQIIGYHLKDVGEYGRWRDICVYFNTGLKSHRIPLYDEDWIVLAYGREVSLSGLYKVEEFLELPPLSACVFAK